jgi:hypothetical protein
MAKKRWIIVDCHGIRCFRDAFKSFEDGWNFLYVMFPAEKDDDKDDVLDEYFVVPETEPYYEQIGDCLWIVN